MPACGAGFFGTLTDAASFHDELEQVVQLLHIGIQAKIVHEAKPEVLLLLLGEVFQFLPIYGVIATKATIVIMYIHRLTRLMRF